MERELLDKIGIQNHTKSKNFQNEWRTMLFEKEHEKVDFSFADIYQAEIDAKKGNYVCLLELELLKPDQAFESNIKS